MAETAEALSVLVHVRNQAGAVGAIVSSWQKATKTFQRSTQLIFVDDNSSDATATVLEELAAKDGKITVVKADAPGGIGASIRAGLAVAVNPLVLIAGTDYPYEPTDTKKLLDAYGTKDEYTGYTVKVVNGCRRGRKTPPFWASLGRGIRTFFRFGLGNPLEPLPGWLGWKHHAASWWNWLHFGAPFHDSYSRFKLFNRELLNRFPIQSDGDFALVEIVGKATFLTTLMTEVPLTEKTAEIPVVVIGKDRGVVSRHPKFHNPLKVDKPEPLMEAPPPEPAPV